MRWFGALLLSLWLACCASAQTFVQAAASADPTTASTTVSVTITAGATGDIIMGMVSAQSSGFTISSVKDNNGVSYNIVDTVNDTGNGQSTVSFYKENISGSPTSITATWATGSVLSRIEINEWSGIATTTPLDVHASGVQTSVGTTLSAPAVTTTVNGDLVYVAATTTSNAGTTMTAVTPFTLRNNHAGTENAYDETDVQATAGSITAQFTVSQTGTSDIVVMAFKPSGGGGPTCPATLALLGVGC